MSNAPAAEQATAAPADELMDGIYRYQRHIYDLTRHYYLLGRDRMIGELDVPPGGTALEIGCGTARNLIAAAKRYPDARFFGIDISSEMLKSARANIRRHRLEDRITLGLADAADFDAGTLFGLPEFDRVFFSYSLSMIPNWRDALVCGVNHVAPGGGLHCVDFSAQTALPTWFGRLLRAWLSRFHVRPRRDLGQELANLAAMSGGKAGIVPLYRDYAVIGRLAQP